MIRVHSRFEHFLEESAPRGRVALPVKETRLQEARRKMKKWLLQSAIHDLS